MELAVAVPLLALMLFGLVDFGRAYFQYIAVVNSAREGARYAAYGFVNLSNAASPPQNTVQGRVQLADGGLGIPNNSGHIQIQFYDTTVSPAALCAHYDYASNAIAWDAPYTAPVSGGLQKCPHEGDAVKITVMSDFKAVTPLMSQLMGTLKLTAAAQARIE